VPKNGRNAPRRRRDNFADTALVLGLPGAMLGLFLQLP
jgi:hypothetical protein